MWFLDDGLTESYSKVSDEPGETQQAAQRVVDTGVPVSPYPIEMPNDDGTA